MPKSSGSKNLVLCTCSSLCRVYNPATGSYEGNGLWIPRSTQNDHVRDQRRSKVLVPRMPIDSTQLDTSSAKLDAMHAEVKWLSTLPISSSTKSLEFLHDPMTSGPHALPSLSDMLKANYGKFSLKAYRPVNQPLLTVELRYTQIFNTLRTMIHASRNEEKGNTLQAMVYDELIRLNSQKGLQWSQQRVAHNPQGVLIINTGRLYKLSYTRKTNTHGSFRTSFLPIRTIRRHHKGGVTLGSCPRTHSFCIQASHENDAGGHPRHSQSAINLNRPTAP